MRNTWLQESKRLRMLTVISATAVVMQDRLAELDNSHPGPKNSHASRGVV